MTTAREQAREGVQAIFQHEAGPGNANAFADAASDVWEPIVRDLLLAFDRSGRPPEMRTSALRQAHLALMGEFHDLVTCPRDSVYPCMFCKEYE